MMRNKIFQTFIRCKNLSSMYRCCQQAPLLEIGGLFKFKVKRYFKTRTSFNWLKIILYSVLKSIYSALVCGHWVTKSGNYFFLF